MFVSHAGPSKPLAEELHDMLHNQLGLTVFLDKYMAAGDAADRRMLSNARGAHVGLALFSREFAQRDWPLTELEIFAGRGSLLPALVPPLSYEAWKDCIQTAKLQEASLDEDVRNAAQRTVMVTGSEAETLAWKQRVCYAVVRALVAKARAKLPDQEWVGAFRPRVRAAVTTAVDQFDRLTVREVRELQAEAAQIPLRFSPPPPRMFSPPSPYD